MWGSGEAGRERKKRVLHMAGSPQRTPLGDTFRKARVLAIWQHSPLVLFSEGTYSIHRERDEISHIAEVASFPAPSIRYLARMRASISASMFTATYDLCSC